MRVTQLVESTSALRSASNIGKMHDDTDLPAMKMSISLSLTTTAVRK
jgi:hypothetical protein